MGSINDIFEIAFGSVDAGFGNIFGTIVSLVEEGLGSVSGLTK